MQTRRKAFWRRHCDTASKSYALIGDSWRGEKRLLPHVGETYPRPRPSTGLGQDRPMRWYRQYRGLHKYMGYSARDKYPYIENSLRMIRTGAAKSGRRAPVQVEETVDYSNTADAKTQINASCSKNLWRDNTGNPWPRCVNGDTQAMREQKTTCGYSTCKMAGNMTSIK